jgi:outer membrane protein assembly factor BamB
MDRTKAAAAFVLMATLIVAIGCGSDSKPASSSTAAPSGRDQAGVAKNRGRAANWATYHGNLARTGVDTTSPSLGQVHQTWTRQLDAPVYGEPLAVGRRVYVATENNTVYALSARNGRVAWQRHLGAPVDASTLPCGNIFPVTGITGTPAISGGRLYVVAFLSGYRHVLFGLRLKKGKVDLRRDVDAPGSDPRVHQQRPALSISKGRVYVPYGGLNGDCGDYKGRVVSVRTRGKARQRTFTVGVNREGGIWAPSGAAVDGAGNLFVATGNGDDTSGFDFGNSVIRLSPKLEQTDFYRASNSPELNQSDTDLGSVGPTRIGSDRLFVIGKEGLGLMLSAGHLGGTGGQLFSRPVCGGGAYGGLAYQAPFIYVPCTDALVALRLDGDSFSVAWKAGSSAGAPIVAGGAVWTIDDDGTLHAYAPDSGNELASFEIGSVTHFPSPGAGGGRLFAPAQSRVVAFAGV